MYEGSVCVCCMSTEHLDDLFEKRTVNNVEVNYAKMVALCLNIQIKQSDGHDSICTACTDKLKDYLAFKKQALCSLAILSSVDFTSILTQDEIKVLGLNKPKELSLKTGKHKILKQSREQKITKTSVNMLEETIASQSTSFHEDTEQNKESPVPLDCDPNASACKRRVGRPRVRSPDFIPYKIKDSEHKCRECGEEFPCNLTLKAHYNKHFGRHRCKVCDKLFMTNASLRKHESSHLTGPFPCKDCGKEFHNLNTLNSHKRLKHGCGAPYRCRVCCQRFKTLYQRESHIAAAHPRALRRYPCVQCEDWFSLAAQRSKHIAQVHDVRRKLRARILRSKKRSQRPVKKEKEGERRFVCKLCSKDFTRKITLKYHIGSHIRKGEYSGDFDHLIKDRRDKTTKDTGLLSDITEEHLDDTFYSDNLGQVDGAAKDSTNIETNIEQYLDDESGVFNGVQSEKDVSEIFTDIEFPSDLEE